MEITKNIKKGTLMSFVRILAIILFVACLFRLLGYFPAPLDLVAFIGMYIAVKDLL